MKRLLTKVRLGTIFVKIMDFIKEGTGKIVKYVSTPLHAYTWICLVLLGAICIGSIPIIIKYILTGAFCVTLLTMLLLQIFCHRKLQFTAEEQIIWRREHLGDDTLPASYFLGQMPSQQLLGDSKDDSK